MKKAKKIGIVILVVLLAASWPAGTFVGGKLRDKREDKILNGNAGTGKTVYDRHLTYQTMDGFGASACWWAQDVGGWENAAEILSYLYDSEKGIGLNVYRYNLGAGSQGDEELYIPEHRTECFLQADGTLDFAADANAQACLKTAKELAGDSLRVELFANSAPVSLTKNGRAYRRANDLGLSNLDVGNYDAYADYLYACAEHFTDAGYRVTAVSPVNEPQYDWKGWTNADGTMSMNQEGCHFDENEMPALARVLVGRFAGSALDKQGVKVSLFESGEINGWGIFTKYNDPLLGKSEYVVNNNTDLRKYFDTLSVHSYWANANARRNGADYLKRRYKGVDVICTEYCQMTNDWNTGVHDLIEQEGGSTNGMGIAYGVAMANIILDDLTILGAKEWDWWTACSYGVYPDGLVYINKEDHNKIETAKRLWCLGNFSKFVREGAVRFAADSGVDGVRCVGFENKGKYEKSLVFVYVNASDTAQTTALKCAKGYAVYTTDETRDLAQTAEGGAGDVTVDLPAQSVVTVVVG